MNGRQKAIALAWTREHPAPYVVATGSGYLAASMLATAEFHAIRVVRDPELAAVLAAVPPGAYIPERTWRAVAAVFSFLDGLAEDKLLS